MRENETNSELLQGLEEGFPSFDKALNIYFSKMTPEQLQMWEVYLGETQAVSSKKSSPKK